MNKTTTISAVMIFMVATIGFSPAFGHGNDLSPPTNFTVVQDEHYNLQFAWDHEDTPNKQVFYAVFDAIPRGHTMVTHAINNGTSTLYPTQDMLGQNVTFYVEKYEYDELTETLNFSAHSNEVTLLVCGEIYDDFYRMPSGPC